MASKRRPPSPQEGSLAEDYWSKEDWSDPKARSGGWTLLVSIGIPGEIPHGRRGAHPSFPAALAAMGPLLGCCVPAAPVCTLGPMSPGVIYGAAGWGRRMPLELEEPISFELQVPQLNRSCFGCYCGCWVVHGCYGFCGDDSASQAATSASSSSDEISSAGRLLRVWSRSEGAQEYDLRVWKPERSQPGT